MSERIPMPLMSVLSDVIPEQETHASIDALFMYADAPGEPPEGNKQVKVQAWLMRANKESENPLGVLGRLIERYMETAPDDEFRQGAKERIQNALDQCRLRYIPGGHISPGGSLPSATLIDVIKKKNLVAIETEFHRALANLQRSPREAVSAACNMLESVCKTFIEDNKLEMPFKKDLRSVWAIVRKELKFEPGSLEDEDLKKILSGMLSAVDGIGSLRTHASSAHGQGRKTYRLEPRHARLAVNAPHTVSMFVLETWSKQN